MFIVDVGTGECSCTDIVFPVCSSNGKAYDNMCLSSCDGVFSVYLKPGQDCNKENYYKEYRELIHRDVTTMSEQADQNREEKKNGMHYPITYPGQALATQVRLRKSHNLLYVIKETHFFPSL